MLSLFYPKQLKALLGKITGEREIIVWILFNTSGPSVLSGGEI
jgi:hypothetical protein